MYIRKVLDDLNSKYPHQPEFLQAASEVFSSIAPLLAHETKYEQYKILERIRNRKK